MTSPATNPAFCAGVPTTVPAMVTPLALFGPLKAAVGRVEFDAEERRGTDVHARDGVVTHGSTITTASAVLIGMA